MGSCLKVGASKKKMKAFWCPPHISVPKSNVDGGSSKGKTGVGRYWWCIKKLQGRSMAYVSKHVGMKD